MEKACDKTLKDLSVSYLDCYLIHWPAAFQPGGQMLPKVAGVMQRDTETTLAETWAEMEKLLEKGKVKNIGLSNFTRSEVGVHSSQIDDIKLTINRSRKSFRPRSTSQMSFKLSYTRISSRQSISNGCRART